MDHRYADWRHAGDMREQVLQIEGVVGGVCGWRVHDAFLEALRRAAVDVLPAGLRLVTTMTGYGRTSPACAGGRVRSVGIRCPWP
jgi:hypothetical protein